MANIDKIKIKEEIEDLLEFFAIPVGLQEVIQIDGHSLYSSNKLYDKYRKAVLSQKQFRGSNELITRLIKKGKLVPCFLSKGILGLTIFKIFANIDDKATAGFYNQDTDIIIMLLNNNMTLGWVSAKQIGLLTAHELCHMSAAHMKNSFLSMFKNELLDYYREVFYLLTGCKEVRERAADKEIMLYYQTLFAKMEIGSSVKLKVIADNFKKTILGIHTKFTTTDKELAQHKDIIIDTHDHIIINYFQSGLDGIIELLQGNHGGLFRFMLSSLYSAYSVFNRSSKPYIFPIQEFMFPSEVICVRSEIKVDPKYLRAWSQIK